MNSERNAFIEAFGELYHNPCDWDEERNCFKEFLVHIAWNAWQLSANRQGYKLVPLIPMQAMLDAQDYIRDESAIEIYKAMIGAADE